MAGCRFVAFVAPFVRRSPLFLPCLIKPGHPCVTNACVAFSICLPSSSFNTLATARVVEGRGGTLSIRIRFLGLGVSGVGLGVAARTGGGVRFGSGFPGELVTGLEVIAVRQPCIKPGRGSFHLGFGGRMRHRSNGVSLTRPVSQSEKGGFADAATRVSSLGVNALCLADRRQLA